MSRENALNPIMILAVGTRVVTKVTTTPIGGGQVCPVGIVGVVVGAPADNAHSYRIRCANGVGEVVVCAQAVQANRGAVERLLPWPCVR